MLRFFHNASIRSKLTASSVVVATIALLLACASFILYDRLTFLDAAARKLSSEAQIVGLNSVSALLFNDADSATSTLKALRAEPRVLAAAVYGKDGHVFARYSRAGDPAEFHFPVLPAKQLDLQRIEHGRFFLFEPILSENESIGKVYLEADLSEMNTRLQKYVGIAALVLLLSLATAMALSLRLQRLIAAPILHLAATAREVSAQKNYSVRAVLEREDETGVLVEAFNDMLTQIQQRDTALTQEVAERRRAEADLGRARDAALEASRLKTAFLANMSHEIRTPLNVILGYNEMIGDRLHELGAEDQEGLVEGVRRGSKRLLNTVHGILDISKIETENFDVHRTRIELRPFLQKELADFRKLAQDKGLFLTETIDLPDAVVSFDEYCLSHAFKNLVDNAIKFTDEGGVFVRLGRDAASRISIEVRDTGIGIAAGYLPHLYEAFSQEKSGSTRPFEGSGLGVALAKRFLALSGATISVESEQGKGTTFTIHFSKDCEDPTAAATAATQTAPATPVAAPATPSPAIEGARSRVLVVEDDADTQGLMKALLGGRYEVLCASSGEEVREHLAQDEKKIRIVLMDLSLKGGEDGLALTEHLRSQEEWKDVPIIALTAHARREDQDRALRSGCTAYLPKPVGKRELLALMESLIERA